MPDDLLQPAEVARAEPTSCPVRSLRIHQRYPAGRPSARFDSHSEQRSRGKFLASGIGRSGEVPKELPAAPVPAEPGPCPFLKFPAQRSFERVGQEGVGAGERKSFRSTRFMVVRPNLPNE